MPKPYLPEENTPPAAAESDPWTDAVHPQDRIYSGMFGHGQVIELLKNEDGYAYGHRVVFENGMEARLLITELPTRH